METSETKPTVHVKKPQIRWCRWLIILAIGFIGGLVGWKKSEQNYQADSLTDVQAVEVAIGGLLDAATTDNMPRMVERDEYVTAITNLSQAMSKLMTYASNLKFEPLPNGFSLTYPNYNAAWEKFLTAFGHLHTRSNRLKATILYYDVAGWYPNPTTDKHDWRKLNQTIPWKLTKSETAERVGYAVGYGGTLAILTWLIIVFVRWVYDFMLKQRQRQSAKDQI